MDSKTYRALLAEAIGTAALIYIGIGVIAHFYKVPGGLLAIALGHGLAIAVMVSATGAISGGHLNPAVTVGAFVGGKIEGSKALAYVIAQLAGATLGAFLAGLSFSQPLLTALGSGQSALDVVAVGTPDLATGMGWRRGMLVEAVLTFFLVFVVYGTGIDPRRPGTGGLAIGLTVAMDILFGGPLTGAAMNPARVFGPAVVSGHWDHHLVYWLGPLVGGIAAGSVYGRYLIKQE